MLRQELLECSVLHPHFLRLGMMASSEVSEYFDSPSLADNPVLSLAHRIWGMEHDNMDEECVASILEYERLNGDGQSLALFGELFVEVAAKNDLLQPVAIGQYYELLREKSPIYCSYSLAKRYLMSYQSSKNVGDLEMAAKHFRDGKSMGCMTSTILYLAYSQWIQYLRVPKYNKRKIRRFFVSTRLFMDIVVGGVVSLRRKDMDAWWRYVEVAHWAPKRVKRIDERILSKRMKWHV